MNAAVINAFVSSIVRDADVLDADVLDSAKIRFGGTIRLPKRTT